MFFVYYAKIVKIIIMIMIIKTWSENCWKKNVSAETMHKTYHPVVALPTQQRQSRTKWVQFEIIIALTLRYSFKRNANLMWNSWNLTRLGEKFFSSTNDRMNKKYDWLLMKKLNMTRKNMKSNWRSCLSKNKSSCRRVLFDKH